MAASAGLGKDHAAECGSWSVMVAVAVVRVAVVEDSFLVRSCLVRLLDADARVRVVGAAVGYLDAVRLIDEQEPDVVVTDVRMPPSHSDEGIRLAGELRGRRPGVGVVVLSQYADAGYASELVRAGSRGRGYLLKDRVADEDQLVGAVLEVAAGRSVFDPLIVDELLAARSRSSAGLAGLTRREQQVLAAVASGASNRVIAGRLVLSTRSVEKHINAIFAKLGLTGDSEVDQRVKATLLYLAEAGR